MRLITFRVSPSSTDVYCFHFEPKVLIHASLSIYLDAFALYRERNRVERLINRLKQFRRVATRYEKRADNYLAMLTIATIILWL